ncbi:MAG: hypothetical protein P1T08_15880 [Acidimicrobiia bacterium]|nr:hypothetical protein [Acidimicrobiia bacterium]
MMQFRGRLRSPGDQGPGLPVNVILDDHGLTIEADGERVGKWSLSDVSASRTSSDQFSMSFGNEHMMFEAEDILSFSYEALPHIDGRRTRAGMLTKIRTAFAPPEAPIPVRSIDLRADPHLEVVSNLPDTAVASEIRLSNTEHCRGTRRDGRPCRSSIVLESGFCTSHDPNRSTSATRGVPVEDPALASVFRQLKRAVGEVRSGRMDPETALALASLARAMCATIDADEAIQEAPRAEKAYLRSAK